MAAIEQEGRIESWWCECIRSKVMFKGYGNVDISQIDDICCPASGTCLGHDWTHGAVEKWWSLLMHSIYLCLCRVCSVWAKKLMTRVMSLHIVSYWMVEWPHWLAFELEGLRVDVNAKDECVQRVLQCHFDPNWWHTLFCFWFKIFTQLKVWGSRKVMKSCSSEFIDVSSWQIVMEVAESSCLFSFLCM